MQHTDIKIQSNTFKQEKHKKPLFQQQQALSQGPNSSVLRIEQEGVRKTLKRIPKDSSLNEIKILQQLDHPNILKLYEFYEDNNEYCLITDYWEGGDLYEYLSNHDKVDEYHIAEIMKQLFSILKYIHSKNIVHRDIKSENILVEVHNDDCILIKLIDWGIATQLQENQKLFQTVGTPYYMAPEVFKQNYDEKCDIWSAGILLYEIIVGELPFYARQANEIQRKILDTKPNFDLPVFKQCSSHLFDLVKLLLNKDPSKRPSAKEVLEQEFFEKKMRKASQDFTTCFQDSVNRLMQFKANNKLQQAVLTFMGSFKQTSEDEMKLIRIFNEIDIDGDGKLTCDELAKALKKLYNTDELQAQMQASILMDQIDIDNNGFLEYSEFVMACSKKQQLLTESNLKCAFEQFDLNGDGAISISELKKVLDQNETISDEKWKEVIKEVDTNGDGEVSYEENEWADVQRQSQFVGESPILKIKYDQDYEEIMDYFRAIVISGEISERVLKLTRIVIEQLPSNYNAYQVRRKCLKQLNKDLKEELEFTIKFNKDNIKTYQIWEHRRQIVEWLNDYTGELESLQNILNEDNKNYHCWSYRVWLCEKFNLYKMELENINYYIDEDIGNNSAWNYRYFLLTKIEFNFKDELEYIKNAIRIKSENEATWNYLRGWFKQYKFKNDSENPYKTFIQYDMNEYNIIDFINEFGDNNRFALSLKIQYLLLNGKYQEAIDVCDKLKFVDLIREKYWEYFKSNIIELIK